MDGEAYIGINKLHMSSQETEVCGAPIQRFAQYEATGVLPIEVYIQRQKLREYMLLGSPEYIRQFFPASEKEPVEQVPWCL